MARTDSGKQISCQLHIVEEKYLPTIYTSFFNGTMRGEMEDGRGFQEVTRLLTEENQTSTPQRRRGVRYTLYLPKSSGDRF